MTKTCAAYGCTEKVFTPNTTVWCEKHWAAWFTKPKTEKLSSTVFLSKNIESVLNSESSSEDKLSAIAALIQHTLKE